MDNYKRVPKHVGVIPDGNRRWAVNNKLSKEDGYEHGILPGIKVLEKLQAIGVKEVTFYGFTKDNKLRPKEQTAAFVKACVDSVNKIKDKDANILVIGNTKSSVFPDELLPYANKRVCYGKGIINVNFLINYDWNWDLSYGMCNDIKILKQSEYINTIASKEISRIDLILRWGGRTRLSGFLPVQSVYSDFYTIEDFWPDYKDNHVDEALNWYQTCDVTLGG